MRRVLLGDLSMCRLCDLSVRAHVHVHVLACARAYACTCMASMATAYMLARGRTFKNPNWIHKYMCVHLLSRACNTCEICRFAAAHLTLIYSSVALFQHCLFTPGSH